MSVHTLAVILIAAMAVTVAGSAEAAAPRKAPANTYQRLWASSPFTVKPPPVDPGDPGPGPLEDFTLASVSQVQEGWFVVLMNKKKREERIRIIPGAAETGGFKVLTVKQDPFKYMETKVELAYKGDTGWIGYEEKYLALKKAAAPARGATPARGAAPRPATPPRPGTTAVRPPTPTPSSTGSPPTARPTRVRRVPTPPQR